MRMLGDRLREYWGIDLDNKKGWSLRMWGDGL